MSALRKSPGPDGIPLEFYLRTYEIIQRELHFVLNEALKRNVPQGFVDGVIVLVRKKGGAGSISSLRPITLLNTDYKLMSRILKHRLDCIIRKWEIISTSQKCSNKPCNIFQAVLSVKERLVDLKSKRKCGKLVSFDLSRAFDRVNRGFLWRTMSSLGFNSELVRLLKTIGEQSNSRVLVNGALSSNIPIQCSVRQGDPLSMHLFVLYLHPLITRLEGICGDQDDLINAYADDISVVTTSPETIERVRAAIEAFGLCSGAKLNVDKTEAIDIGHTTPDTVINIPWLRTVERLRLLGILFTNNIREAMGQNWDIIIQKFRRLVYLHRVRDLNLVQKVVLMNTFLLPKLWFVASVCSTRAMDIAKVANLMGILLWSGSNGIRIPLQQLALPRKQGGLNLHIPDISTKALLTNRYVNEQQCLRVGAHHISYAGNPPDIASVTSTYPCLRSVIQVLAYTMPTNRQGISSKHLRSIFLKTFPTPKIVTKEPTHAWNRIWKNISSPCLTSEQRSALFLVANGKITHGVLLHRMGRITSPKCVNCQADDSLEHMFAICPRVFAAWNILQHKILSVAPEFNATFHTLRLPELTFITRGKRIPILRLFSNYIIHIVGNNDVVIDLEILKCSL